MQTRFFLSDGRSVYAPYLSESDRMVLRKEIKENGLKMYCGCSKESPLYYGISADLRVIPLHKFYEHKKWCSRFDSTNRTSAATYDEDGSITLFVSFKPHTFTMSTVMVKGGEDDIEEEGYGAVNVADKEEHKKEGSAEKEEKKETLPSFNLYNMLRFLNHDTYMNRMASGKYPYLSEDYFISSLYGHIKNVRISGMKKPLKELSLKEDKIQFFYTRVEEFTEKSLSYKNYKGNISTRYVPVNVMAKAEEVFEKKYGITVRECMSVCPVMAGGFQYERLNRLGATYRCIGRMVFFPVTEYGLFADSLLEVDIVNVLMNVCKKHNCLFLYSEDDRESIVGIIRNNKTGKEAPVFLNRRAKGMEAEIYFSCRGMVPCVEELEAFLSALV